MSIPLRSAAAIFAAMIALVASVPGQQRLLVIGGGERPPDAMRKFVEWSGGAKARILVITWASGVPEESFAALKKNFEEAGAGVVNHAPQRPLDDNGSTQFAVLLRGATGVFFSGGDQNRIMEVLSDDVRLSSLKEKYRTGTPFGGTSAGAAVMSDPMMTGEADLKVLDGSKVGVRKGLGLIPNVIFDQHFLVRQRHNRLFGLIMVNPKMLGIGIDEDTAVLIEDNRRLTVLGKTQVMFVHSEKGGNPYTLYFLKTGERYDLKKKRSIKR
ncbi:MAG TPA: cyanophycinase [Pyrinomonadaceae bacterium]|nr:cyanophycinase [Pyrinomonadaceae bacterium]